MIYKDTNTWLIINAENQILGRLASKIAILLTGKNKTTYKQNTITGDQIIIINSKKIKVTGNKATNKIYYKHTGYPGGLKSTNFKTMLEKNPNYILKNAIKGMLPKNKLQKIFLRRLKIYKDANHPHEAQKPLISNI